MTCITLLGYPEIPVYESDIIIIIIVIIFVVVHITVIVIINAKLSMTKPGVISQHLGN